MTDDVALLRQQLSLQKIKKPLIDYVERLTDVPATLGFFEAIESLSESNIVPIGEIFIPSQVAKKKSRADSAVHCVRELVAGGAAALSISYTLFEFLNSPDFFASLQKKSIIKPVVWDEPVIDEYQLYRARISGADAVTLGIYALKEAETSQLVSIAKDIHLDLIFRCNSKSDIDRSVDHGARCIGLFYDPAGSSEASFDKVLRMKRLLPNHLMAISFGGVMNAHHVKKLEEVGFHAVTAGSHLRDSAGLTDGFKHLFSTFGTINNSI